MRPQPATGISWPSTAIFGLKKNNSHASGKNWVLTTMPSPGCPYGFPWGCGGWLCRYDCGPWGVFMTLSRVTGSSEAGNTVLNHKASTLHKAPFALVLDLTAE